MFSVVIPLFNKAHTIKKTLDSVFKQSFSEFEIVIINDGSTDNSVEVINQFYRDPRIRIINQVNKGVSIARNKGVSEAKFNYIAFLDGDDEWFPEYLDQMNKVVEMYPTAGMYCCAGIIRDNNGEHLRVARKYKNKILEVNYFENPHVFSHTSATIVDKRIFSQTIGFPPGMKCNQDFALFYAMALISKVVYCGKLLSIYNGDIEGQTTSISEEKRFGLLKHVVDRVNLSFRLWEKMGRSNRVYMIFDKYETRQRMLGYLKTKDYRSISYYLDSLEKGNLETFPKFELRLIQTRRLNFLAQIYIYITKLVWRRHGFPITGKH